MFSSSTSTLKSPKINTFSYVEECESNKSFNPLRLCQILFLWGLKEHFSNYLLLRRFKDTLKAFEDFKSKQNSVWSNVFWYIKVCIFWTFIQYTMHWDKTQKLKKIPLDKINRSKNALFFLSLASTHHNFTFNLRFLYEV